MTDILLHQDDYIFSYRVAGVFIQDNQLLLQKPLDDEGFAIPGGHLLFGETQEEALIREFKEELGIDIEVGQLLWVAENFFPWGESKCQEICFYYQVQMKNNSTLPEGAIFNGTEQMEGQTFELTFHWKPLDSLREVDIYPTQIPELMSHLEDGVSHFVYREGGK